MLPFLEYWKIQERPFEGVCDSRYFYESAAHREVLARLHYLAMQESMMMGMLTGEVGCGKTTTLNQYMQSIDSEQFLTVFFENSFFSIEAILKRILNEWGLGEYAENEDFAGLYVLFSNGLDQIRNTHQKHLLLIFDEAQDMAHETLTGVCRLTNLNGDGGHKISVILAGQPELRSLVHMLPPVDQRISLRFHLQALSREEVAPYLRHRLMIAGAPNGEFFSEDAVNAIYESSGGVPREINRLAKLSMEDAAAHQIRVVDAELVLTVFEDLLRHHPQLKKHQISMVRS